MNNFDIVYNKENDNWFAKIKLDDYFAYYDKDMMMHRLDGPAVEDLWYLHGKNLTNEFKQFIIENDVTMDAENYKIFLFERRLKKNLTD
jgi:hypothetical protein